MSSGPLEDRRTIEQEMHAYLVDVEQLLLSAIVHASQLEEALATRTTIGQAVGLFMAQEAFTSDEAFQKLVAVSQTTNVKLRDIAQQYVEAWECSVQRSKE